MDNCDKWSANAKCDDSCQDVEETSSFESLNDVWYSAFFDSSSDYLEEHNRVEYEDASLPAPETVGEEHHMCTDQSWIDSPDKEEYAEKENGPKDSNLNLASPVADLKHRGCEEHPPKGNACQGNACDSFDALGQNDNKLVPTTFTPRFDIVPYASWLRFIITMILYIWMDLFDLGFKIRFWIHIAHLALENRDRIFKLSQYLKHHGREEHPPEGNACQENVGDNIDALGQNDNKLVPATFTPGFDIVLYASWLLFIISLILYIWMDHFDLGYNIRFWIHIAHLALKNRDRIFKLSQYLKIHRKVQKENVIFNFKWIYEKYKHHSFKRYMITFPICSDGSNASATPRNVTGERMQNSYHYSLNYKPVRQVCEQSDGNETLSDLNQSLPPSNVSNESSGISDTADYLSPELIATGVNTSPPSNVSNESSGISDTADFLSPEVRTSQLIATGADASFVPDSGYNSKDLFCVKDDQHPNCIIVPKDQLTKMSENKIKQSSNDNITSVASENRDENCPRIHLLPNGEREQRPVRVRYGNKHNLSAFLRSQDVGGLIIESALRRDIEDGMFEQQDQYRITSTKHRYNTVCVTKSNVHFLRKTISRQSFSIDKLDKYITNGDHETFLQTLYGVIVREASVELLFSYRKGVTLEEYTLQNAGKRWSVQQTILFIYHLVLAVQTLHRMGISLLGITSESIQLDEKCSPSSIRFLNVQFSNDAKELNENDPLYSPPEWEHRSTHRSYDMWCVGAVLYFLVTNGRQLWGEEWKYTDLSYKDWSTQIRQKIRNEAASVHVTILSVGGGNHSYVPALKHLMACLLNPDWQNRATSIIIHKHPLFYGTSSKRNLERDLLLVNPGRHGSPHCVVTVTNGHDIVYVTTVPKGKPLFSLLITEELQQQLPRLRRYRLDFDRNQHYMIMDDVILEIRV